MFQNRLGGRTIVLTQHGFLLNFICMHNFKAFPKFILVTSGFKLLRDRLPEGTVFENGTEVDGTSKNFAGRQGLEGAESETSQQNAPSCFTCDTHHHTAPREGQDWAPCGGCSRRALALGSAGLL